MKKFKFSWLAVAMLALTPAISSCSSDDSGITPEGPSSATSSNIDGTRVTRVGDVVIKYDKKNRPYLFTKSSRNEVEIDYEKGEINYYEYNELAQTVGVSFNGSGFISKITLSYDIEDSEYAEKASGEMRFSYDGDGHLTKIKEEASGRTTIKDEDISYNFSVESTYDYTWNKGNLVEIEYESEDRANGMVVESDEAKSTFEYSRQLNEFEQFPMSLCYDMTDEFDVFFAVGLFGNGPANLPTSTEYEEDGRSRHNYSISFSLNDNDSFNQERINSRTWNYSYSDITRSGLSEGNGVALPTFFGRLKAMLAKNKLK